jgi:hypothetical protein
MRVTYRAYIPLMSALMGYVLPLHVSGKIIEFAVTNATNACVCVRPHGEATVNANSAYYYEGQQQMPHTPIELLLTRHV